MGVLNVPIQINGGASSSGVSLLDRELFIDNSKNLFVKTNNAVGKVNCNVSDSTISLTNSNTSLFSFNKNTTTFMLGYLRFNGTTFTSTNNVIFSGVTYRDIPKMVLRNTMYGTSLPRSGEQGQIFFLLQ